MFSLARTLLPDDYSERSLGRARYPIPLPSTHLPRIPSAFAAFSARSISQPPVFPISWMRGPCCQRSLDPCHRCRFGSSSSKEVIVITVSEMEVTARALVAPGKGILAADESLPTIEKRCKNSILPSTEENQCAYRELLFITPGIEGFISGLILFDETIRHLIL